MKRSIAFYSVLLLAAPVQADHASGAAAGYAYGVSVDGKRTPLVKLPPSGDKQYAATVAVTVSPGVFIREVKVTTRADITHTSASTISYVILEQVDLLDGLITADAVFVQSGASWYLSADGRKVWKSVSGEGTRFIGLKVAGVAYGDMTFRPNTKLRVPGVGSITFNEQIEDKRAPYSNLEVNALRVKILGKEIVIGSAYAGATVYKQ